MSGDHADIQAQLDQLRQVYASQLPDKIAALNASLVQIKIGDAAVADKLEILHRQLHGLAGSGATFGFVELGQQARYIELQVKA